MQRLLVLDGRPQKYCCFCFVSLRLALGLSPHIFPVHLCESFSLETFVSIVTLIAIVSFLYTTFNSVCTGVTGVTSCFSANGLGSGSATNGLYSVANCRERMKTFGGDSIKALSVNERMNKAATNSTASLI